jgi:drug/metabolite transporter (DMT)-like permease
VRNILRTVERKRPLTVHGVPGLAAVLLGVGLTYWAVLRYAESGSLPVGVALGAALCLVVGLLAAVMAVVLRALNVHHE